MEIYVSNRLGEFRFKNRQKALRVWGSIYYRQESHVRNFNQNYNTASDALELKLHCFLLLPSKKTLQVSVGIHETNRFLSNC